MKMAKGVSSFGEGPVLSPNTVMQRAKEWPPKVPATVPSGGPTPGTRGAFKDGFFPSPTADPVGNAALEDPEKRPPSYRETPGLLLSGRAPLY